MMECDHFTKLLQDNHGGVDFLINNAGRSIRRAIESSYDRFHDYERTMQLNYFGCLRVTMGVLPGMVSKKKGHVVNISSIGVLANAPRFSAYVASKAALDAWTRCASSEFADQSISFTTINMPLVRTPMIAPTGLYNHVPTLSPEEAADMVVTDDNFASLAAAVEEGRGVFDNIRKTVHFLLSCNLSEVLVMLFAALLGLPLPLLPIQILWMNLVTDGIPALALAVDPKAPDLMKRPPRRPEARLLDGGRLLAIGGEGLMLGLIALGAFSYSLYGLHQELDQARTVAFTVMVVAQLVHVFNCRSERLSLFQLGVGTNRALVWAVVLSLVVQVTVLTVPAVATIFKVAPLPIEDWALMGGMGLLPFLIMEAIKVLRR